MSSSMSYTTGGAIRRVVPRLVATELAALQRDYGLAAVELKAEPRGKTGGHAPH